MNQLRNFTPLLDSLVEKYGLIPAAIYGRVYRYCQMPLGKCTAPLDVIAIDLEISYKTVQRYVKLLVKEGYLKDLTPKVRHTAKQYAITGKAFLSIEAYDLETPPDMGDEGRTLSPTLDVPEEQTGRTLSPKGRTESPLKKVLKKELKRESTSLRDIEKNTSTLSKNAARKDLELEFNRLSKLPSPDGSSESERMAAGKRWWQPLRRMCERVKYDGAKASAILAETIRRMRKEKLTFDSPASIEKVYNSIVGEVERGDLVLSYGSRLDQILASQKLPPDLRDT